MMIVLTMPDFTIEQLAPLAVISAVLLAALCVVGWIEWIDVLRRRRRTTEGRRDVC